MHDHNPTNRPAPGGAGRNHTPDASTGGPAVRLSGQQQRGFAKTTAQPIIGPRHDHTGLQPAPVLALGGA